MFNEQSWNHLESLSRQSKRLVAGDTLTLSHYPEEVGIVREGLIRVFTISLQGEEKTLRLCAGGDFFGEQRLLGTNSVSLFAESLHSSQVLWLPANALQDALANDSALQFQFLQILLGYETAAMEETVSLALDSLSLRLLKTLLRLARKLGEVDSEGWAKLRVTQAQLATLVATPRECVSVHFQEFRQQGYLKSQRGSVTIHLPTLERKLELGLK